MVRKRLTIWTINSTLFRSRHCYLSRAHSRIHQGISAVSHPPTTPLSRITTHPDTSCTTHSPVANPPTKTCHRISALARQNGATSDHHRPGQKIGTGTQHTRGIYLTSHQRGRTVCLLLKCPQSHMSVSALRSAAVEKPSLLLYDCLCAAGVHVRIGVRCLHMYVWCGVSARCLLCLLCCESYGVLLWSMSPSCLHAAWWFFPRLSVSVCRVISPLPPSAMTHVNGSEPRGSDGRPPLRCGDRRSDAEFSAPAPAATVARHPVFVGSVSGSTAGGVCRPSEHRPGANLATRSIQLDSGVPSSQHPHSSHYPKQKASAEMLIA